MPDPHMPDHLLESLKAENARLLVANARLVIENHSLTAKVAECNDHKAQFAQALALATTENQSLKRTLSGR